MTKNLTFIVIVVIVLWQIVYGLIQKAAKERQQDRMRQLADQRRRQQGTSSPPRTAPSPPRQSAATRLGSRLEDLAERRKAQLEELRRRRASRPAAGPAQVGVAPGAPSGGLGIPPAPPPKRSETIRTLEADRRALREADRAGQRRQLEQQRRDREATKARSRIKSDEELRRAAERAGQRQQEAAKRTARAGQRPPREPEVRDAYAIREGGTGRAHRLKMAISSRATLRDLFIVKELLDSPLALRARSD